MAHLFFTCFAASSLDSNTVDEGEFRQRIRQLLGHEEGTSYPLTDLPLLWLEFARWLEERRKEGAPYRALVLPDPGWMTRIGYSIGLAFPSRLDRQRLLDVLVSLGCDPTPTVPEAFRAIGRARDRFSLDFRHVFDRARIALASGRDAPELQALWSAVLEAVGVGTGLSRGRAQRTRYQIFLQDDDLFQADPFLAATAVVPPNRATVSFTRLEEPFGEYGYFVSAADGSTLLIAKLLLLGALEELLPHLKVSPVARAVEQGVLLFRRNDNGTWELATSRPSDGPVRALVQTHLSASFRGLLRGKKAAPRPTKFDGWVDIGPFDVTALREPASVEGADLADVRCLQRVDVGPQLHFVGGVRLDGGFLGTRGLLPDVRCPEAQCVTLFHLQNDRDGPKAALVATLVRDHENPDSFKWGDEQGGLEGSFVLAGTREGGVIASREVVFHSRVLSHDYAVPTDPQRWLVEASSSDMAPAGEGIDAFLAPTPESAEVDTRFKGSIDESDNGEPLYACSVDSDSRHDRLVEAVAAISAGRKGIAESELLELLQTITAVEADYRIWDVVRGWVEAGYLDVLTRRHWRGRVYFARRPRLIAVSQKETTTRVVLHGLAPFRLRAEAAEVFAELEATPLEPSGYTPDIPAPPAWGVESVAQLDAIARRLRLGPVEFVRDPSELTTPVNEAISDLGGVPAGYERQGLWDWQRGGFRRPKQGAPVEQVRIEWYARANGPDRYVVVDEKGTSRSTMSRTWALVVGFVLTRKPGFQAFGARGILRPSDSGPYVPLPVARALLLRTGVVSGPFDHVVRGRVYAYCAEGRDQQRFLLQWLGGLVGDAATLRRFAWLLAASQVNGAGPDVVAIPTDMRHRLRALTHIPEALLIAERRIPRRLLPHVRRAVDLVGA